MSTSAVMSSKALTGLDSIIAAIELSLEERRFPVSSAVKELVARNLAARESVGGHPNRPVWQGRAAVELLQPWWQDDAVNNSGVAEPGDVTDFVAALLMKIEDLWSELFITAAGDPSVVDDALADLASASSSGVNPRRSSKDAAVQAAIDLLSGIRLEL